MTRRRRGIGDTVRSPATIILLTTDGCIMSQQCIPEDGSVPCIPNHLKQAGQPFLGYGWASTRPRSVVAAVSHRHPGGAR
jgi:hypothetical protein